MNSFNQSSMNDLRNTSRRNSLFSNLNQDDSMASRQSRENNLMSINRYKSPFYEGKVSFGGSSAKRVRLSQVLPYNLSNKPASITRIKESDIKRSNEIDHLSSATKNMLENIYKVSSPLEDAKRIPVFTSSNQSNEKFMIDIHDKPFKRLSTLRTPKLASNYKITSPLDREKLQLKWEELENSSMNNSHSHLNRNLINDLVSDTSGSFYQQQKSNQDAASSHAGGKMRNRITRTNRLSKWTEDDYVQPPQYELSNASLPINSNSLPTFNLNSLNKRPTEYIKSSNVNSLKRPLVSITQEDDNSDAFDEFQFSAPKLIKLDKISESFYKDSIKKNVVEQIPKSLNLTPNKTLPSSTTSSAATNLSIPALQSQKPNPPSTDLINLETNKTVEMYKLDKLDSDFNPKENKATLANTNQLPIKPTVGVKLANEKFNFDGLPDFVKNDSISSNKKWICTTCDVRNELTDSKCVSCEQPRLKEAKDKSNYTFGTINTEKRNFNAFKIDAKPPTSIVSSSNNSILSNTQPIINTTATTKTEPLTLPSLGSSLSSNSSENKIELASTTTVKSIDKPIDKPSSSDNGSTALTDTTKSNEQNKPFNFITSEVVDKIEKKTDLLDPWTQFKRPKDTYQCSTCLVSNKLTVDKCPCCEAPNPNKQIVSKDNNKAKEESSGIKFSSSSTGFSFDLAPKTTTGTTVKNEFSFINTNTNTNSDNKFTAKPPAGFSFTSLSNSTAPTTTKSDQIKPPTEPKFSFGLANANLISSPSTTTSTANATKTTSLNECKNLLFPASSSNTLNASSVPSFSFDKAQVKDGDLLKTKTSNNDQSLNKPISSNFTFGSSLSSSTTSNLNNGELSFNLNASNTQNPPQSAGIFSLLTTPNNSSTAVSNASNSLNNFNQFGNNKTQFGLPSTNIFSPPTNLTNGFGSSVPDNLFSNAASQPNSNQSSSINNFSNAFSQVPISFNFSATEPAQTNNVFQFNAPKSDAPINQQPLMNNQHGRFIKKAKRRLGQKDN